MVTPRLTSLKHIRRSSGRFRFFVAAALLLTLLLGPSACFTRQTVEDYYGRIVVRQAQEFRWSDGGLPQIFDPAFAAAPPDTDAVRAIFEGLTDYDPRTLAPVPGVAKSWDSSNEGRVWTFYLRDDARWSNGEPVTASDFVRSWRRALRIGQLAPHTELLANIVGVSSPGALSEKPRDTARNEQGTPNRQSSELSSRQFGAEAVGDHVLRVHLRHGDINFPALVAHPVFRPVKASDEEHIIRANPDELVSNGAFRLSNTGSDHVLLERANHYWGREGVTLQRVEFVGTGDSESALAAYRAGDIDAVTNASFEPLALKLLTPYKDFRRTTYGALTYYSFNTTHAPFDDVRVREALTIAVDRERISHDDLGGATDPARKFLPEGLSSSEAPVVGKSELLDQDLQRAKTLLAEAGYPEGKGFPTVRLIINRNEQQRIVAQAVAAMWRSVLNIETQIQVKNWDEYETVVQAGDYDVVRRGMVMQTADEFSNIQVMFQQDSRAVTTALTSSQENKRLQESAVGDKGRFADKEKGASVIESEAQALTELRAMPIYFASSYALVKPYVTGFDSNVLDAPSLKSVRIDTKWRAPSAAGLAGSR